MLLIMYLILVFSDEYVGFKTSNPPTIDGHLESTWNKANQFSDFTVYEPVLSKTPQTHLITYFMYDEEAIYIAGKIFQKNTHSSRLKRDDISILKGDYVQIELDPFNTGDTGYFFTLNPNNAFTDGTLKSSGLYDYKWDGKAESATHISENHWSFELKIPLETIDFQDKPVQDWHISFFRHHAETNNHMASHRIIPDDIKRISSYTKLTQLADLKKKRAIHIQPYITQNIHKDYIESSSTPSTNTGFDLTYQPNPTTNLLVTYNPDYAQIESDKPVINVTDVATIFPEKRPFFTANLYHFITGVQTRKVRDIDYGLKLYNKSAHFNYDFTYVKDKQSDNWLFSRMVLQNEQSYKHQLEAGLKQTDHKTYFNGVFGNLWYFWDKKLSVSNYLELTTKDGPQLGDVQFVTYKSRDWFIQNKFVYKQVDHNPEELASKPYTNRLENFLRINRRFRFENMYIQYIMPGIYLSKQHLLTDKAKGFNSLDLYNKIGFHFPSLGTLTFFTRYIPDIGQHFRFRTNSGKFRDNYSRFDLIPLKQDEWYLSLTTDQSKFLSFDVNYERKSVRQAPATFLNFSSKIHFTHFISLEYRMNYGFIDQSSYQEKQTIRMQQLSLNLNLTDRMNLRTLISSESQNYATRTLENAVGYNEETPLINVTGSWEFEPGSFVYLVFNRYQNKSSYTHKEIQIHSNYSSIRLKINKSFRF